MAITEIIESGFLDLDLMVVSEFFHGMSAVKVEVSFFA
jgi:hypothetical protein